MNDISTIAIQLAFRQPDRRDLIAVIDYVDAVYNRAGYRHHCNATRWFHKMILDSEITDEEIAIFVVGLKAILDRKTTWQAFVQSFSNYKSSKSTRGLVIDQ